MLDTLYQDLAGRVGLYPCEKRQDIEHAACFAPGRDLTADTRQIRRARASAAAEGSRRRLMAEVGRRQFLKHSKADRRQTV